MTCLVLILNIAERLIETDKDMLMECNQYDYYWSGGRDRLGHNTYGKVLINICKNTDRLHGNARYYCMCA